jgi:ParB-like chromosome segregation protein Spo0J
MVRMTENMVSWKVRYNLEAHEAADWFDMLEGQDLLDLVASIRENGLKDEIDIWERPEDGVWIVLDGRNRLTALSMLDIELTPEMEKRVVTDDPVKHIFAKNMDRRHLTPLDRRKLILKRLGQAPEHSDRAIAEEFKVSHPTVAAIRKEGEATGKVLPVTKRVGLDRKARKDAVRPPKPLTSASSRQTVVTSEPAPKPLAAYLEKLEQETDELKAKLASRFEDLDQPELISAAKDCIRAMDVQTLTDFKAWFREFTGLAHDRKDKYAPMIAHLAPSGAAPKRRGRPSKHTQEQRAGILSLTAQGHNAKFIAEALCVSEQDVYTERFRAKRGDQGAEQIDRTGE